MTPILEPISETTSLIDPKFELEMYFCKIYKNDQQKVAYPFNSFLFYTRFTQK